MKILVSACLLGCSCRYDGKSKPCPGVLALRDKHTLIPVCPEQLGGLATPRPPAEIIEGKLINDLGHNVTQAYERGAQEALKLYETLGCHLAILKSRSPSCGCGQIYDGTFSGKLRKGDGVTAALLKKQGILVLTEEEREKISQL